MKARIEQRHIFRAIEVQFPPMRSFAVLPADRIDVEKIAPIVESRAARDGDRHAGALVIRAQHAHIACDETIFHRIDAIRVFGQDQLADLLQSLLPVFNRYCVFELVEVRDVFDWIDFRTIGDPLEVHIVRVGRLVSDVHHLHLANVVLALDLGDSSDVGQAVEVSGFGDRTPEETEMAVTVASSSCLSMQESKSSRQSVSLRLYAEIACSVIVEITPSMPMEPCAAVIVSVPRSPSTSKMDPSG